MFVVATGDMVNNGRELEQLQTYANGLAKSPPSSVQRARQHDASVICPTMKAFLVPATTRSTSVAAIS